MSGHVSKLTIYFVPQTSSDPESLAEIFLALCDKPPLSNAHLLVDYTTVLMKGWKAIKIIDRVHVFANTVIQG